MEAENGGRASPPVLHQSKKPRRWVTRLPQNLNLYTLKEDPQPQVLFTFGFSNLKPAPSRVST